METPWNTSIPLIEWIPRPILTDELLQKLSDDGAATCIDYAEELFDSGEEAQKFQAVPAAFYLLNLDNFLRQHKQRRTGAFNSLPFFFQRRLTYAIAVFSGGKPMTKTVTVFLCPRLIGDEVVATF